MLSVMREFGTRQDPETCGALAEMRQWLDAHGCTPVRFDIVRGSRDGLLANAVSKITSPKPWEREFGS